MLILFGKKLELEHLENVHSGFYLAVNKLITNKTQKVKVS